jgi:hypothetical protein
MAASPLAAVEQRAFPLHRLVDVVCHRANPREVLAVGVLIHAELLCGSGNRSAAHDGEHKAEIVPVDRAALIQHFRTSMVQYLGLVSYKMQVKRVVKVT